MSNITELDEDVQVNFAGEGLYINSNFNRIKCIKLKCVKLLNE